MAGIGVPELIVILLVLALLLIPISITLHLRKKRPNTTWIGLLLAFIFTPIGQIYLDGSFVWIIALLIFYVICRALTNNDAVTSLLTSIMSMLIMYYRLLRHRK